MDATGPTDSAAEDRPVGDEPPADDVERKPTSVRSSAEVAETVSSTYDRLARPGKARPDQQ